MLSIIIIIIVQSDEFIDCWIDRSIPFLTRIVMKNRQTDPHGGTVYFYLSFKSNQIKSTEFFLRKKRCFFYGEKIEAKTSRLCCYTLSRGEEGEEVGLSVFYRGEIEGCGIRRGRSSELFKSSNYTPEWGMSRFRVLSLRRERDALTVASSGTVASSAPGVQNARLTVGVHSS